MGRTYGYIRVSTKEQNLDRQVKSLIDFGVPKENIKADKESGKNFDRPAYQLLKNDILREGDTLVIKELDRLGRNKEMIKSELNYFKQQGIRIKVLNVPTTLMDIPEGQEWIIDMINNILIEVLGAIAEEERNKIKARQAEGIAVAKEKGTHMGRPKAEYPIMWEETYKKWKAGEITATKAMDILQLKRTTFYKLAKQYEN
ncbi:MAG: recombinase family protein [Clostridium sp.]|nr:recombinase family protein [Clostridium sp.]MDU7085642.1 recombinase family protein [Clostridium sp.]